MGMQGSRSLIAGYPFEGNCNDVMQTYNGTPINITYVEGIYGKAARCNGTDGYITQSGAIKSEFGNALSISFWIKPKSYRVLGSLVGSSTSSKGITIRYADNISKLETYIGTGSAYKFLGLTTTHGFIKDAWSHLVVIFDGSNLKTYINCVLLSTFTVAAFTPDWGVTTDFNIGANANGAYNTEQDFDSIKIYNKALTQEEVQLDYINKPIF